MLPKNTSQAIIYTDGACNPNPGPGGWGVVILFPDHPPYELRGSEPGLTTNNRMEMQAAIEALRSLSVSHKIRLYTDSKYLRLGITEWLPIWERQNWHTFEKNSVKNRDLWKTLQFEQKRHEITWKWIKGHGKSKWNQRADFLATSAVPKPKLPLNDQNSIHIFTAASFLNRTGEGGWGVILHYRNHVKIMTGHTTNTSSNRMHIIAAVKGLEAVKRSLPVHIYTTSGYLKSGGCSWKRIWFENNWRTRDGQPVKHRDVWKRLHELTDKFHVDWHIISSKNGPCAVQEAKLLAQESRTSEEPKSAPDIEDSDI